MTKEESLLIQRYKVIAPYPKSPYEVGDLVEITPSGTSYLEIVTQEMSQWTDEIQGVDHYSHLDNIKAFPNLFQPLPWYAERKIEDLPAFVKHIRAEMYVFTVKEYRNDRVYFINGDGGISSQPLDVMLPASPDNYNNSINSKK